MIRLYAIVALALWGAATDADAGAWTLSRGEFWGKLTYFRHSTEEWYLGKGRFGTPGARVRYDFDGRYESSAAFIEGFYGLSDRLDLGVQIPYFDQSFANSTFAEPRGDAGLSDIRVYGKLRLIDQPLIFTLKTGAKMPTGEFKNEDGLIPVGEGQWDFDFVAQFGRSFWPLLLYANIDLGYRVRTHNAEIDRDPGDEWFLNAEVGYNLTRKLMLIGKCEILRGDPAVVFGGIKADSKRITYIMPVALYAIDDRSAVEAALRISLNGRNYPAGRQWVVGVSTALGGG